METIKNYLDSMFSGLPKTEEVNRLKMDLLANMEDKYYELKNEGKSENEAIGIVISEFGNIDEIVSEMGISVKPEQEENLPVVALEQAREYIEIKSASSRITGIAVSLILLGVSLLVFLTQIIQDNRMLVGMNNQAKSTIPVIILIMCIVPAVAMFIYSGTRLEKFRFIENNEFTLASTAKTIINNMLSEVKTKQTIGVIIGVSLCIMSVLPIFIGSMISKAGSSYGVSILLIMISVAVFLFITTGSVAQSCRQLLQIDDYAVVKKKENKVIGIVARIVWPMAVCIFLIAGVLFDQWGICWIVFPITGILFAGFSGVYSATKNN
jgi:hypothetical protein